MNKHDAEIASAHRGHCYKCPDQTIVNDNKQLYSDRTGFCSKCSTYYLCGDKTMEDIIAERKGFKFLDRTEEDNTGGDISEDNIFTEILKEMQESLDKLKQLKEKL